MSYMMHKSSASLASQRAVYINFDPCVMLLSACLPFLIMVVGSALRPVLGMV